MGISTVMWWTTATLFALWILGIAVHFGSAIHVLFWLAVVMAITNLVNGRSRA